MGEAKRRRAVHEGVDPHQRPVPEAVRRRLALPIFDPRRATPARTKAHALAAASLRAEGGPESAGPVDRAAESAHRVADDVLAAAFAREGTKLACRAGCAHCCKLHVDVTAVEALALAAFLRRSLDVEACARLRERLRETVRRIAPLSVHDHALSGVPCTLLRDDGTCSAYEVRPISCRRWHSEDVQFCLDTIDPTKEDPEGQVNAGAMRDGLEVLLGLSEASMRTGRHDDLYELNHAVLLALEDEGAAARWWRGEDVLAAARSASVRGDDR